MQYTKKYLIGVLTMLLLLAALTTFAQDASTNNVPMPPPGASANIPYLDQALKVNDALLGLPALPLLFLSCLAMAVLLRVIPVFPNQWLASSQIIFGMVANLFVTKLQTGSDWGRALLLGLITGVASVVVYRKYLKDKIETSFDTGSFNKPPLILLPFLIAALACGAGCAALQPGADPFIVGIERAQTVAEPSFDLVLALDHQDRGFWRTNAPAFHRFCEDLRQRVPWSSDGRTNLPRYLAAQLQVSQAKADYRAVKSSATSNAAYAALLSLQSLSSQTAAWLTIVTNKPAR